MGSMPFALSLHNLVSSVGADAGFAAMVGLAILVLLYFAHARETTSLREQAAVLSERLQQAEAKLAQMRDSPQAAQVTQPPVTPPPGVPTASRAAPATGTPPRVATAAAAQVSRSVPVAAPSPVAAGAIPAAPVGMAAPALAAATRVIPAGAASPPAAPAAPPEPAPQPAAPAHSAPVSAPPPARAAAPARAGATSAPVRERTPAPATAAGAGNGAREPGDPGAGPGSAALDSPPRRVSRPPARPTGRTRIPPPEPARRRGGPPGRRLVIPVVVLLLVVAVVAGLLIATSGSGNTPAPASSTPASNAPSATPPASSASAFSPASVNVAVLNGTATNHLARNVANKLASAGYKQGTVATAANQTLTKTVVAFMPGHRSDALHVAQSLKLPASAVSPIDSSTQAIACPQTTPCTATVVVTVGSDLATLS